MIQHTNFRVHIHLGAHKTASTFLQDWLARHRDFLGNQHIAYVPLGKLRRNFTPAFGELANAKGKITPARIAELRGILFAEAEACGCNLAEARLFILSDENLLGSMSSLHNKGVLYPRLNDKMRLLASIFADYEVRPFLALRNYRDFYPSAYAETLRRGFIKPFENYLAELDLNGNSWLRVVAAIESSLGPARIWPYEQFRNNAHLILTELLQTPIAPDMINAAEVVRKSLTDKGLQVAMRSRDLLSELEMKKLINLLAENMQFEAPDEKISIKDKTTVAFFNDKYKQDLAQLSSRLIITEPTV